MELTRRRPNLARQWREKKTALVGFDGGGRISGWKRREKKSLRGGRRSPLAGAPVVMEVNNRSGERECLCIFVLCVRIFVWVLER